MEKEKNSRGRREAQENHDGQASWTAGAQEVFGRPTEKNLTGRFFAKTWQVGKPGGKEVKEGCAWSLHVGENGGAKSGLGTNKKKCARKVGKDQRGGEEQTNRSPKGRECGIGKNTGGEI